MKVQVKTFLVTEQLSTSYDTDFKINLGETILQLKLIVKKKRGCEQRSIIHFTNEKLITDTSNQMSFLTAGREPRPSGDYLSLAPQPHHQHDR